MNDVGVDVEIKMPNLKAVFVVPALIVLIAIAVAAVEEELVVRPEKMRLVHEAYVTGCMIRQLRQTGQTSQQTCRAEAVTYGYPPR